jgi:Tfp pilus assembly protein PilV
MPEVGVYFIAFLLFIVGVTGALVMCAVSLDSAQRRERDLRRAARRKEKRS